MSDPGEAPYSDNPNAAQIPDWLHLQERNDFIGVLVGTVLYGTFSLPWVCSFVLTLHPRPVTKGITITLFFQCISALLNPANRMKRGTKWGLMAHTVTQFSLATTGAVISRNILSNSFVDNREFPGNDKAPPGAYGYKHLLLLDTVGTFYNTLLPFNQWLADGLLVSSVSTKSSGILYNCSPSCIAAVLFIA
jgi:hypothetical protein